MHSIELPPVSPACRTRLTAHYGSQVDHWLDSVPGLMADTARRRSLHLTGYHDAGHASVIATAWDLQGRATLIKAWPDRERFISECNVLRLWYPGTDTLLRSAEPGLATAVMNAVGGTPGGAPPPKSEAATVALALSDVHEIGRRHRGTLQLPLLHEYVRHEVMTRVRRRAADSNLEIAGLVLPLVSSLATNPDRTTVLHADLYRENILFAGDGRPVLLDPLPMEGDSIFDWAFWCVYYTLGQRTYERLSQAQHASGIPLIQILPWCLLLGLDGLLFYEETGDSRLQTMSSLVSTLIQLAGGAHP
jgi:streptomycin 6-kinase